MPEGMSGSGDYVHFKAHVPLHHIPVFPYPVDHLSAVLLASLSSHACRSV